MSYILFHLANLCGKVYWLIKNELRSNKGRVKNEWKARLNLEQIDNENVKGVISFSGVT